MTAMLAESLVAIRARLGEEVGVSDWVLVDQARIQAFADATLDQQWLHTDPARAAKGPFGGPIAHGLLSLSLLPYFAEQMDWAPPPRMSVNYGYDKVRLAPLPAGHGCGAGDAGPRRRAPRWGPDAGDDLPPRAGR